MKVRSDISNIHFYQLIVKSDGKSELVEVKPLNCDWTILVRKDNYEYDESTGIWYYSLS